MAASLDKLAAMRFIFPFCVAGILLSVALAASAEPEKISCVRDADGAMLAEIRSLAALPESVSELLGRNRTMFLSIADRNEKFNATDVVYQDRPMRRFALAGRNANCLLVAIERGGFAYWIELLKFEKTGETWRQTGRGALRRFPASTRDLEEYSAALPPEAP
ncbi:MAG: hypothetical protein HY255_08740 [Betaproteobacteria bacterium]|nr:hypothetical protein [Betaproteobacteria bacterium]